MVHLQEGMLYCVFFAVAGGETGLPTVQSFMSIISEDPRSQKSPSLKVRAMAHRFTLSSCGRNHPQGPPTLMGASVGPTNLSPGRAGCIHMDPEFILATKHDNVGGQHVRLSLPSKNRISLE